MPKTDRTIPPPSGDKEPLKTNVYQFIQNSVTALAPLFPYYDEGSIVPCFLESNTFKKLRPVISVGTWAPAVRRNVGAMSTKPTKSSTVRPPVIFPFHMAANGGWIPYS